jgi:hypothetical protein
MFVNKLLCTADDSMFKKVPKMLKPHSLNG